MWLSMGSFWAPPKTRMPRKNRRRRRTRGPEQLAVAENEKRDPRMSSLILCDVAPGQHIKERSRDPGPGPMAIGGPRSELNTLEHHASLTSSQQADRSQFWKFYYGGACRLPLVVVVVEVCRKYPGSIQEIHRKHHHENHIFLQILTLLTNSFTMPILFAMFFWSDLHFRMLKTAPWAPFLLIFVFFVFLLFFKILHVCTLLRGFWISQCRSEVL